MKKIILPFLLLMYLTSTAQQSAPLKKITVYPTGAVLEHKANVNLKKGTQTITLRGLAADIDAASMLIEIDGYVNVLSHKYMRDYKPKSLLKMDAVTEEKIAQLEKNKIKISKEISALQHQISIENKSIEMILNKQNLVAEKEMNVNALSGYVSLYKDEAYKSQAKVIQLTGKQDALNDSIVKINKKITTLRDERTEKVETDSLRTLGNLEIQLYAPQEVSAMLEFSYYAPQARWNPSYDILGETVEKPLRIKYKANIFQNTGIDWNNVKVSVSTAQPNLSNTQPMLSAWYLDVYKGYQRSSEGLYNSNGAMNSIPSFGVSELRTEISMIENTGLNISFDSEMTYSIPSDNKQQIVLLKTLEVNCIYKYYTVPKLDKDVFLLAEIQDFEQYNFLPGEAQVFLEGKNTGKTLLDPFTTTGSINLSMGRDKNVVVKRERYKLEEKVRFVDLNKEENYNYKIIVKNNKAKDITIIIKDQYPLSQNEKIVISEKEHSKGGELNEGNGVVTWIETIGKMQSREVSIGYKVTRPKNMVVPGL